MADLLAAWPLWLAMVSLCLLMACLVMACLKPLADRYRDDDERSVEAHARSVEALRRQHQ